MRSEFEFDPFNFWEGEAPYHCDCCGKVEKISFDNKDDALDYEKHRQILRERGWITEKVNGEYHDFCGGACRNLFVRKRKVAKEENTMSNNNALSLRAPILDSMWDAGDETLNEVWGGMVETGQETGEINIKIKINAMYDVVPDYDGEGEGQTRKISKPRFDYVVSSIIQRKDKKSGSCSGDVELVFDRESGQYVYRDIDNGQTTLFDEDGNPAYDADYNEGANFAEDEKWPSEAAESDDVEGGTDTTPDADVDAPEAVSEFGGTSDAEESEETDEDTPYGWLKQFIGTKMHVTVSMGNYTVRTEDNKVVLSSATKPDNVFYCDSEKLSGHVGHTLICYAGYDGDEDAQESVKIVCSECGKEIFRLYRDGCNVEPSDEEKAEMLDEAADAVDTLDGEDNYPYEQPED